MKQHLSVPIHSNRKVAQDIYLLELECPLFAQAARPGQFVNIYFPGSLKIFPRPFSIAGIRGECIQILYKVVGSQTRLMRTWKPGDSIRILGLLGNSFELDQSAETHVLLAGGIGVAPLLFLADWLSEQGIQAHFFIGVQTENQHADYADLKSRLYLSSDDGSIGFRGNVVEHFQEVLAELRRPIRAYACGPDAMLHNLAGYCLEKEIDLQLSLEKVMACGLGLCQGCVVKMRKPIDGNSYKLVCKDGPVFKADEVLFDE